MINQSFFVSYPVRQMRQWTDNTCWSAATSMLTGAKWCSAGGSRQVDVSDGIYFGTDNMKRFAQAHGLILHYAQTWPIESLLDLMTTYGPLWVGGNFGSNHCIVIGGIWGDGSNDETYLNLFDPWYSEPREVSYGFWIDTFPEATGYILHAPQSAYPRDSVPTSK